MLTKLDLVRRVHSETKNLCQNQEDNLHYFSCTTSLKVLDQLLPHIQDQDKILKDLVGTKRVKRGWFNGFGTAFKMIFGTLDSDDALYYNEAIKNMNEKENNIVSLLQQQTQIVKTTISDFNSTITNLEKSEAVFNKNLATLQNFTNFMSNNYFNIEFKQELDEHIEFLTLVATGLNNEYSTFINAILFSKTNTLHPKILTPEQYILELRTTVQYLPSSAKYPLELEPTNGPELLSLAKLNGFYVDGKLIIIISTPLITQNLFSMYNLILLPIQTLENEHIFVLPSAKYLVMSQNKLHYSVLPNIDACNVLSNNHLMCKLDTPLYSVHGKPICAIELLLKRTISKTCDTRISVFNNEIWHRLYRGDQWIYVLPKETDVTLNCKSKPPIDVSLFGTGILSLTQNCKLFTSNTVLSSTNHQLESFYHQSILPKVDLVNDDCCKHLKKNKTNKIEFIPLHTVNLDKESLTIASHKLEKIDELSQKLNDSFFRKALSHTSYFSWIIIILFKFVLLYLMYRLILKCRTNCKLTKRSNSPNCAKMINCLTFNMCKTDRSARSTVSVELDSMASAEESVSVEVPLRRSTRIAQLRS